MKKSSENGRGSNIKYNPYAFTEQGIYMLMMVLKGKLAIRQSMALIRLFKEMKVRGVPEGLEIMIFSDQWGRQVLTEAILADFRAARPDLTLSVRSAMGIFHDRYVFIDYNEESDA